ncbi:DUF6282 family protein [Chloroflexota bacterium]
MSVVDQLMKGAVDMHVHAGPDPLRERRLDAIGLAMQASEMGMRAIVIKCQHYGTAPVATIVNQIVTDFLLIGSLVLDGGVGGLNPEAVEVAARGGAKIVWMPTFSSVVDVKRREEPGYPVVVPKTASQEGTSLIDQQGKLLPRMVSILEIMKSSSMVLATGHISVPEIYTVTTEARRMGIRVIITHPLTKAAGSPLNLDQQRELASKGAYIEHCFNICLPPESMISPAEMVEYIKAVGAEHCILATDFGQNLYPAAPEGFRMMLANMLVAGLSEKELEILVKVNPARILDLD